MIDMAALEKENQMPREQIAKERVKNSLLQEKINLLINQKYAAPSKKISADQLGFFNEAEELNSDNDNDNDNEIDVVTKTTTVKSHERKTRPHIITASKPKQLIEKSIASPGLLAYIAVQKYADALPLYRQSEMLKRIGNTLDRTNLANWTG